MTAPRSERVEVLNDFLASTQIFSTAMTELLDEQVRAVLGKRFTLSQLKLLKMVARTSAATISEVAALLAVSNAAASKAVDRLVRRGLIRRTEKAEDRRAITLSLTAEGQKALDGYENILYTLLDGLFRRFTPDDLVAAGNLLDRLSADLVDAGVRPDKLCFRCGIYFRDKCLLRDSNDRVCYYHLRGPTSSSARSATPRLGTDTGEGDN